MNVEFVEELRLEYGRRERASENLAKKTKNLMMASGIVATLMVGVYGMFAESAESQETNVYNLLLAGVLMMLLTVMACVWSNRVEFQRTILLGANMTKCCETDFNIIKSWTDAKAEDYYEAIIDEYVKCLNDAEAEIKRKVKRLNAAIFTFLVGLSFLPITLIYQMPGAGGV